MIIEDELPSAQGQTIECGEDWLRNGLSRCWWSGLKPKVAPGERASWVQFNVSKTGKGKARIDVLGKETRSCKLTFDKPITGLKVDGVKVGQGQGPGNGRGTLPVSTLMPYQTGALPKRASGVVGVNGLLPHHHRHTHPDYPGHYPGDSPHRTQKKPNLSDRSPIYPNGTTELRLWARDWNRGWRVDIEWELPRNDGKRDVGEDGEKDGITGNVVCLWADVNEKGTVPAWDEVREFVPKWAVGSKLTDGLVEGWWGFSV